MAGNGRIHPPQPMAPAPEVSKAKIHLTDLKGAVERIGQAWNKSQLDDALRSARYWLDKIEKDGGLSTAARTSTNG